MKKMKIVSRYTILILSILIATNILADDLKDSDLDGVLDKFDKCPNTPFLNEVDRYGCTSKILKLPEDSSNSNLIMSLGFGYLSDEDNIKREKTYNNIFKLSYYKEDWIYTLSSRYYLDQKDDGFEDIFLKIKRRFSIGLKNKLYLGAGLKVPTGDFKTNKIDYNFYSSLTHYISDKYSYFIGLRYSVVNDKYIDEEIQNSYLIYMGSGYFFNKNFYANLSYSFSQSKFKNNEHINALSSTLYYKINKRFFTTIQYQREIGDEDLHDRLSFKIGVELW